MATLGKDATAGLAERLSLTVVHHEPAEHDIAERAGVRESEVHRFLEGEASLFERWNIDRKRLSRHTAEEVLASFEQPPLVNLFCMAPCRSGR
jgi:hypothetical protein